MANNDFSAQVLELVERYAHHSRLNSAAGVQMAEAALRRVLAQTPAIIDHVFDLAQLYIANLEREAFAQASATLDRIRAVLSQVSPAADTSSVLAHLLALTPQPTKQQPNRARALHLADLLDWGNSDTLARQAAAELRRLHAITESPQAPRLADFFYRIDGFDLRPGNKTAGFTLSVATAALQQLQHTNIGHVGQGRILEDARQRLVTSGMVSKTMAENGSIAFWGESACPRFFMGIPSFGGSIGANPEELSQLVLSTRDPRAPLESLPGEIVYTPHNMDSPKEAFVILVLVQAWAEYVQDYLRIAQQAEPI